MPGDSTLQCNNCKRQNLSLLTELYRNSVKMDQPTAVPHVVDRTLFSYSLEQNHSNKEFSFNLFFVYEKRNVGVSHAVSSHCNRDYLYYLIWNYLIVAEIISLSNGNITGEENVSHGAFPVSIFLLSRKRK